VEAFPILDMVEGTVHAFGAGEVRASVSKARILAPINFGNRLDGGRVRPFAVVDGQVSGMGDVSVERNDWIMRDVNMRICDPSLRDS
jgi:hypothetical protein